MSQNQAIAQEGLICEDQAQKDATDQGAPMGVFVIGVVHLLLGLYRISNSAQFEGMLTYGFSFLPCLFAAGLFAKKGWGWWLALFYIVSTCLSQALASDLNLATFVFSLLCLLYLSQDHIRSFFKVELSALGVFQIVIGLALIFEVLKYGVSVL